MDIFAESRNRPARVKNYKIINLNGLPANGTVEQPNVIEREEPGYSLEDLFKPVRGSDQIASFDMAKFVVVQALYEDVMGGANPSPSQERYKWRLPVVKVSFKKALEFCNQLSVKSDLEKVYSFDKISGKWTMDKAKNGYRLPTVEEWLYAANGGTIEISYPYSGSNNPQEVAWYQGDDPSAPHEVGLKKSNELGLYDMSGNVWEWCWNENDSLHDWCCGGAYNSPNYELYLFDRYWKRCERSGSAYSNVGFRLVKTHMEDEQ